MISRIVEREIQPKQYDTNSWQIYKYTLLNTYIFSELKFNAYLVLRQVLLNIIMIFILIHISLNEKLNLLEFYLKHPSLGCTTTSIIHIKIYKYKEINIKDYQGTQRDHSDLGLCNNLSQDLK